MPRVGVHGAAGARGKVAERLFFSPMVHGEHLRPRAIVVLERRREDAVIGTLELYCFLKLHETGFEWARAFAVERERFARGIDGAFVQPKDPRHGIDPSADVLLFRGIVAEGDDAGHRAGQAFHRAGAFTDDPETADGAHGFGAFALHGRMIGNAKNFGFAFPFADKLLEPLVFGGRLRHLLMVHLLRACERAEADKCQEECDEIISFHRVTLFWGGQPARILNE